jgi:hypothetical protein
MLGPRIVHHEALYPQALHGKILDAQVPLAPLIEDDGLHSSLQIDLECGIAHVEVNGDIGFARFEPDATVLSIPNTLSSFSKAPSMGILSMVTGVLPPRPLRSAARRRFRSADTLFPISTTVTVPAATIVPALGEKDLLVVQPTA